MWEAIRYVGTPLTFLAFLVAAGTHFLLTRIIESGKVIKLAPPKERAELIAAQLETYHLTNDNLTKEQKYNLLVKGIDERAGRYRTAYYIALCVGVVICMTVISIVYLERSYPVTPATLNHPNDKGTGEIKVPTKEAAAPVYTPPADVIRNDKRESRLLHFAKLVGNKRYYCQIGFNEWILVFGDNRNNILIRHFDYGGGPHDAYRAFNFKPMSSTTLLVDYTTDIVDPSRRSETKGSGTIVVNWNDSESIESLSISLGSVWHKVVLVTDDVILP